MPKKTGYHKIQKPSKVRKNTHQVERQLQLPFQPLFMRIKNTDNRDKTKRYGNIAIKILAVSVLIIATLLISSAYHRSIFENASSNLSLKYKEVNPSSIDDIIEALEIEEQNLFQDDKSTSINDELYDLYEEDLPEDNHVSEDKTVHKPQNTSPLITIVIDDMGINVKRTKEISSLQYPITASFLTYANNLKSQIAVSKANGQEIMAHLPMEPQVMQNFTSKMLTTTMSDTEVKQTLKEMLDLFSNIVAVNNHMGSKFTEDKHRMSIVMEELAERNLIFLDSKTTSHSASAEEAAHFGVKLVERNVFLDNKDDFNYIMGQLRQTEEIARTRGHAIAIGHPKEQTYLTLKAWLPTLKEKGIRLVPLSKMVKLIQ